MLGLQTPGRFAYADDNWGANPGTSIGVSVTPGTSNSEGSWTALHSALAYDGWGIQIRVHSGATAGNIKSHLLDIGIDPAGGTSYAAFLSNIVCGSSNALNVTLGASGGHTYFFPMFVPAGSTVAARIQGSNATAGTVRVATRIVGQPSRPILPPGLFSETIGTITNSVGVTVTPGNAADGSYVSLGTTSKRLWWWQLCVQNSDAAVTTEHIYFELAFGDGSNKHTIQRIAYTIDGNEGMGALIVPAPFSSFCDLPAGSELYVRARCSGAPNGTYDCVAVGVG